MDGELLQRGEDQDMRSITTRLNTFTPADDHQRQAHPGRVRIRRPELPELADLRERCSEFSRINSS